MTALDGAIEVLVSAREGGRELDARIHCLVSPERFVAVKAERGWAIQRQDELRLSQPYFDYPYYTTSLDAAFGLVSEGTPWTLRGRGGAPNHRAEAAVGEGARVCTAASPALAICLAVLTLRASRQR